MRWSCTIALLGVAAGVAELPAQQVPERLTLEAALELAREYNPAYRRAVVQADASGAEVRQSVGQFLPNLSGSLSFNGSRSTVQTGTDDFGQPTETTSRTFESSSASQSLSTSLTLFDGFRNVNNLRAARAGADATAANLSIEELQVEADVKRTFHAAVQQQELVAVEERLLEIRVQQLTVTQRLFEVAARDQVDVLGAESNVAQQELALEQARGEARKARLQLAEQIGIDQSIGFEVAGELTPLFDPATLDRQALVARAVQRNPRILQAEASRRQASHNVAVAKADWWPSLSASASFSRSVSQNGFGAIGDFDPDGSRGIGFGFSLSVPIFSQFQRSNAVTQANAQREQAEETLREQRLALEREVRSAIIDVETAHRRVELAEQSLDISRRRLQMAEERFQLGGVDFTTLQQVFDQAAAAERSVLNARLQFANAVTTLEQLVGERVRP